MAYIHCLFTIEVSVNCTAVFVNLTQYKQPKRKTVIGESLSEPHIGTAGRFHILWYDRHPRAAVGRTKYAGLP